MEQRSSPISSATIARLAETLEAVAREVRASIPDAIPPLPTTDQLSGLLATAFWASLKHEEGRPLAFSLAIVPFERAGAAVSFTTPLDLNVDAIVRLAPALNPKRRSLAVTAQPERPLSVWGIAAPSFIAPTIETTSPGVLVVRYWGRVLMVFEHGEDIFLEGANYVNLLSILAGAFKHHTPFENPFTLSSALIGIIQAMLSHGHGGLLLILPSSQNDWQQHLASIRYQPSPPSRILREAVDSLQAAGTLPFSMPQALMAFSQQQVLRDACELVGLLTAIDGATIVNTELELTAFGAMIKSGRLPVETEVYTLQPGRSADTGNRLPLARLGGARHRSAAEFCAYEHDAIACVASQDGPLTVIGWLEREQALCALQRADLFLK